MDEPEGATPLDPDEAAGLKLDSIQTRSDLDRVEQANIIDGLRWLRGRRHPDVLSEAFMLELHRQLFGQVWQWAGRFRQTEKSIGVDPLVIGERLHLLLGDCRYWTDHGTYPAQELALRFHHRLVSIHPFANGNGRHSRIAADAVLRFLLGEPPINWIGAADPQHAGPHRKRYIQALQSADGLDYTPLLTLYGND